jgi:thiamine-monophosphate kinase
MSPKNNQAWGSLGSVGEQGFLRRFLPRLKRFESSRFRVPPGDDAAVLSGAPPLVLSIDGLTEGTHFRMGWSERVERIGGFSLARGLGWKLLGSALSDLAAMGYSERRWAMVYLGGRGSLTLNFLNDLYRGLREKARLYKCALAGGDTVRAHHTTLVAAVGADQPKGVPFRRDAAKPGDVILIAGAIGDASIGLEILEGRVRLGGRMKKNMAAFFVHRFFEHVPRFDVAGKLARAGVVACAMDVSDSVHETVSAVGEMSGVGAIVHVDKIPVSTFYRRWTAPGAAVLSAGENYALLFTCPAARARAVAAQTGASVVGVVTSARQAPRYFLNGKPVSPLPAFGHFA